MNRVEAAIIARAAKASKELPMPDRFWAKVDVRGPDDCWPWLAAPRNKNSTHRYGAFWLNRRHEPANKVAWELKNGPMAHGMFACHTCDNPECCNPSHIFPGTNQENTADKVSKGRQVKGEQIHTAKLTSAQVAEIRAARPPGKRAPVGLPARLSAKYGVTKQHLSDIWSGRAWSQL